MPTYCTSDLHLHDDDQPYLFTDEKEQIFAAIAGEAVRRSADFILAGDILDLTGMTPPAEGLSDFFAQVLDPSDLARPEVRAALVSRSPTEQIAAVARRFPRFFDSLKPLAQAGRLVLIPGNHDYHFDADTEARAALAAALGVPRDVLRVPRSAQMGGFLIAAHGNDFDESNLTGGQGKNRGAAITSALYRGVMPALQVLGVRREVLHAIPAVRPEENIVSGLLAQLGPDTTRQFLLALLRLLDRNGYFEGLVHYEVWFATHVANGLITPDHVRASLADDSKLKQKSREGAQEILAGRLLATPGQSPPRVVVLGHTHELDATENYVNLGTWIDHVRGLLPADLIKAERSLPVLCIEDPGTAVLRDATSLLSRGNLSRCTTLWSYPG